MQVRSRARESLNESLDISGGIALIVRKVHSAMKLEIGSLPHSVPAGSYKTRIYLLWAEKP